MILVHMGFMDFAGAFKMGLWVCLWIRDSDSERDCYGLCAHVCSILER